MADRKKRRTPAKKGISASLIDEVLAELYASIKKEKGGHLPDYIPELAKADPDQFGIVIATVDGSIYAVGDSEVPFTIQSISKPFAFGLALEDHGMDEVLRRVGVEPSGDAFNSIVFDQRANRPFNPMVNAGAIVTSSLVTGPSLAPRVQRVRDMLERYIGHPVEVDEAVFASEKATGHRNRAIAHLELNFGMLVEPIDEHLDLYFQQCSMLVTARDLARMAATLANGGLNPATGVQAVDPAYVKNVISVMNFCGMYDYSGEWGYRIGLPAKSGVAGGVIAVLPGVMGIGVFSPPLDERGNSYRGIKVCETLSQRFGLNMFDVAEGAISSIRRSYDAATVSSKRTRSQAERTALDRHGAAIKIVELRGRIHFAAIEQISRLSAALPDSVSHLILDLSRSDMVEPQAALLIVQLMAGQAKAGRIVRLAMWRNSACGEAMARAGVDFATVFADADEALEWAENDLLAKADAHSDGQPQATLAEMNLLRGLDDSLLDSLATALEKHDLPAGSHIVREGEPASDLYFLARGTVTVSLNTGDGHRVRLTTLDPGVAFGEMALVDGAPRSADIIADTDVSVYVLSLDRLDALSLTAPAVHAALLRNIGRELSQRLRKANREIRSFTDVAA